MSSQYFETLYGKPTNGQSMDTVFSLYSPYQRKEICIWVRTDHTYHVHELIYHSLSGLYLIIFGQNNYAIISTNTPYSVPLLQHFYWNKYMKSSLYNITYCMSILILCFLALNNSFCILCYFSLYALYNKFLIIL